MDMKKTKLNHFYIQTTSTGCQGVQNVKCERFDGFFVCLSVKIPVIERRLFCDRKPRRPGGRSCPWGKRGECKQQRQPAVLLCLRKKLKGKKQLFSSFTGGHSVCVVRSDEGGSSLVGGFNVFC